MSDYDEYPITFRIIGKRGNVLKILSYLDKAHHEAGLSWDYKLMPRGAIVFTSEEDMIRASRERKRLLGIPIEIEEEHSSDSIRDRLASLEITVAIIGRGLVEEGVIESFPELEKLTRRFFG